MNIVANLLRMGFTLVKCNHYDRYVHPEYKGSVYVKPHSIGVTSECATIMIDMLGDPDGYDVKGYQYWRV